MKKYFEFMSVVLVVLAVFGTLSTAARATESHEVHSDSSEFELEKGLVDQIYSSTLDANRRSREANGMGMGFGVSLLSPRELVLTNSYYSVSWAAKGETFPMPYVSLTGTLANWNYVRLGWSARVGYSYREGLYSLQLKTAPSQSQDFLRMHWASALTRMELSFTFLEWLKPVLFGGLGGQWIFQVGRIDGVNQNYLIPSYALGGELVLFDQARYSAHWFSGVRVGMTYLSGFASEQAMNILGLDIGASFNF